MEINILWIAVAAFGGGMATSLIGWFQQGGPWDGKKFGASVLMSLIGAFAITAAVDYSGATAPIIYFVAFLSGAGVEVGGNRIVGAIAARLK